MSIVQSPMDDWDVTYIKISGLLHPGAAVHVCNDLEFEATKQLF